MSPNQVVRLDSDHAQNDGKSVNRGPSILVPRVPVSSGHMVGEILRRVALGTGMRTVRCFLEVANPLLNERWLFGFRSSQEATLHSAVIVCGY